MYTETNNQGCYMYLGSTEMFLFAEFLTNTHF